MPNVSIDDLKKMLVENCVLKVKPGEITADAPLFGPGSVGLDSLDALQMTVAIQERYGVAIGDAQTARDALRTLNTLREWLAQQPEPGAKQ